MEQMKLNRRQRRSIDKSSTQKDLIIMQLIDKLVAQKKVEVHFEHFLVRLSPELFLTMSAHNGKFVAFLNNIVRYIRNKAILADGVNKGRPDRDKPNSTKPPTPIDAHADELLTVMVASDTDTEPSIIGLFNGIEVKLSPYVKEE